MFSYRHGYHAGNYADVFKHLSQLLVINKLKQKDKPFVYMDSHSGGGLYALDDDKALKNSEFSAGIDRLISAVDKAKVVPEVVSEYLQLVNGYRRHQQYPGSPQIAADSLREQDKLCLMEWHNNEFETLRLNMRGDRRIALHHRDGYEGLQALTPPKPARGFILIDPSYELADEYQKVVSTIQKVQQRWPTTIIALWYPLLASSRDKSQQLEKDLAKLDPASLFIARLSVKNQEQDFGMHGSGMAFINLPWQVDQQIVEMLPLLHQAMSEAGQGEFSSQWLIQPK
ncbi:23S rRNA (adenine(2030)-N(6))-methyltransferase RlmJ [Alteromonadaceae bacterium BrNp21-10]|nr:23S rRNA (adenine(2030)-N(6))-methyltransferase RlmJ [Alteromonadaceae bacterium BrNp21-10]